MKKKLQELFYLIRMFNIDLSDFEKNSNEVLHFTNVENENGNVQ